MSTLYFKINFTYKNGPPKPIPLKLNSNKYPLQIQIRNNPTSNTKNIHPENK